MTPNDLRDFQAKHTNWLGKRLDVDGVIGPMTQWALDISRLEPWRQAIVARACSCVDTVEEAPNRSILIDTWNRRAGAKLGSPYCASGASWCISVDGAPEVREASAQRILRILRRVTLIQAGDVGGAPTGKDTGHVGIVIAQGPGEVAMVEFNHGNRVALVRRLTDGLEFCTNLPILGTPAMPAGLPPVPWSYEGTR